MDHPQNLETLLGIASAMARPTRAWLRISSAAPKFHPYSKHFRTRARIISRETLSSVSLQLPRLV